MPASDREKRVEGRVLREFKHGELKSGPGGKGGTVKSHAQAVAIALSEAGASRRKTSKARTPRTRKPDDPTVLELRAMAAQHHVPRRSRLTKQQLKDALGLS